MLSMKLGESKRLVLGQFETRPTLTQPTGQVLAEGSLWEGQAHRRLIREQNQTFLVNTSQDETGQSRQHNVGGNWPVSLRAVERSSMTFDGVRWRST
eukprot:6267335-Prymnesium_polylepis.1